MLLKFLFSINSLILQGGGVISTQEAQNFKDQQEQLELSRLTTVLSIALITILSLLTLSLWKSYKFRKEIDSLKKQLNS